MSELLYNEARSILLGNSLGRGSAREVFVFRPDPSRVIKIETGGQSFQNVIEWEAWEYIRGTDLEKWFAPCHSISSCGVMLVQSRGAPRATALVARPYPGVPVRPEVRELRPARRAPCLQRLRPNRRHDTDCVPQARQGEVER